MNTLVTIQHKTRPQDDLLNKPEKWDEFAKAWCKPVISVGGETQPNQQTVAQNTWTWETHWTEKLAGVTPKMRIVVGPINEQGEPAEGAKVLPIKSAVNELMANRKLIITCEETS